MSQPATSGDGTELRDGGAAPVTTAGDGDSHTDATFTVDERGRIAAWSAAAASLYGFTAREVVGRHPTMLVSPDLDFERDELMRAALSGRPVAPYETERRRKDGSRVEVAVALSPLFDATGRVVGARVDVRPLDGAHQFSVGEEDDSARTSRRQRSQRRLAEVQERFRIAFLHAPNGIALLSTAPGSEGTFLDANPALALQLGCDGEGLIGRSLFDFLPPAADGEEPETLAALLGATGAEARPERRFVRGDGCDVWLQIGASVVHDGDGRPLYAVANLQDVTAARWHEAELRHLADHDGLTGLLNRRCFGVRLEEALAGSRADGGSGAVLLLDLDKFKAVNDTCGHAVGDQLLRRVSAALRSRVRESDVVARLGGDEFGILLNDVTPATARDVAAELLTAVEQEAAVVTSDCDVRVTASIGLSMLDAATRASAEGLLSDADTAMYAAKRSGRNRFATGPSPAPRIAGAARPRRAERTDAPAASGRLELWEQPLLNLATGDCDRVELLARMRGRHGEEIPARRFLPVLKRFGRVREVDSWVLEAAVALIARRQADHRGGDVEINLDAASITDDGFVSSIRETLAAASVDPAVITFGITAAASITDVRSARRLMESLGELGCRFALDHFGASAGSLRDLKHLPFDALKIDGELIAQLPERRFDRIAVRAIADVGHGSGLTTVAEHVADDATLALLREYGIDYAQGFHVAVPRPATSSSDRIAAA